MRVSGGLTPAVFSIYKMTLCQWVATPVERQEKESFTLFWYFSPGMQMKGMVFHGSFTLVSDCNCFAVMVLLSASHTISTPFKWYGYFARVNGNSCTSCTLFHSNLLQFESFKK